MRMPTQVNISVGVVVGIYNNLPIIYAQYRSSPLDPNIPYTRYWIVCLIFLTLYYIPSILFVNHQARPSFFRVLGEKEQGLWENNTQNSLFTHLLQYHYLQPERGIEIRDNIDGYGLNDRSSFQRSLLR